MGAAVFAVVMTEKLKPGIKAGKKLGKVKACVNSKLRVKSAFFGFSMIFLRIV